MGGYSEAVDCPRCGSPESLERSIDSDDVSGYCIECGYSYRTEPQILSLAEVNEERAVSVMPPLTELKKPVEGWKDDEVTTDITLKNVRFVKLVGPDGDMEDMRRLTNGEAQDLMKILDCDSKVDEMGEFTEECTDGVGHGVMWDTEYRA